jgi:hypothetical protein
MGAIVGLAGACMDFDHLVPGLSRDTHLPVVIIAWIVFGCYVALSGRYVKPRVLKVTE